MKPSVGWRVFGVLRFGARRFCVVADRVKDRNARGWIRRLGLKVWIIRNTGWSC
jgi:hypothetical protein